jgi:CubicO group peptidase (beta-lactamase class C family)
MRFAATVFVTAALAGGNANLSLAKEAPGEIARQFDAALNREFPAEGPGAAVLVLRHGRVLLEKGFGLADVDKGKPITPDTNFDLASVSKQFTAFAVMLLADRGKLAFDDDVRKYVPELPAPPGPRPVRVRDLLQHTSGIPTYTGFWEVWLVDFAKLTNERVIGMIKARKYDFAPGTDYAYSNSNYVLLAEIVRRVSGRRFSEFMRDEVFRPLGMNRTVVVDDMPVNVVDRATGYEKDGDRWQKVAKDGPSCGDGNVFSNLRDLAKWDAAIAGERLAKPSTWRLALSSGKLDDGKDTGYGFGWVVEKQFGRRFVWHNGGWIGTRTIIARWPDQQVTIVCLSNNEEIDLDKVLNRIRPIVFGEKD